MGMKWVKNIPVTPGYYWAKIPQNKHEDWVGVVSVISGNHGLYFQMPGDETDGGLEEIHYWSSEPIQLPE